jgi:hypothetical protein
VRLRKHHCWIGSSWGARGTANGLGHILSGRNTVADAAKM